LFATLCKIWPAFEIRTLDLPHTRQARRSAIEAVKGSEEKHIIVIYFKSARS